MAVRCIACKLNKIKVYFDLDKARNEAKKLAIENEQTYAIFTEGKSISFTDADTAIAKGYPIIELVSKYI